MGRYVKFYKNVGLKQNASRVEMVKIYSPDEWFRWGFVLLTGWFGRHEVCADVV